MTIKIDLYSDTYFMREALKEAQIAFEEGEIPVGAIVVCQNQIVARGHNQTERLNDVTAHAEMIAITSATNYLGSKYLNECTLYVTLEPCVMCSGAMFWSQLKKLVFGLHDKSRGYSSFQGSILHPKTEVLSGVMAEESEHLIKTFFNDLRS